MQMSAKFVITSLMTAALGCTANIALAAPPTQPVAAATPAPPAPAASDLDVTMDVVDTTDDVAGAKEIDVGDASEAVGVAPGTTTDADNVQEEVQSGAQDTSGG